MIGVASRYPPLCGCIASAKASAFAVTAERIQRAGRNQLGAVAWRASPTQTSAGIGVADHRQTQRAQHAARRTGQFKRQRIDLRPRQQPRTRRRHSQRHLKRQIVPINAAQSLPRPALRLNERPRRCALRLTQAVARRVGTDRQQRRRKIAFAARSIAPAAVAVLRAGQIRERALTPLRAKRRVSRSASVLTAVASGEDARRPTQNPWLLRPAISAETARDRAGSRSDAVSVDMDGDIRQCGAGASGRAALSPGSIRQVTTIHSLALRSQFAPAVGATRLAVETGAAAGRIRSNNIRTSADDVSDMRESARPKYQSRR